MCAAQKVGELKGEVTKLKGIVELNEAMNVNHDDVRNCDHYDVTARNCDGDVNFGVSGGSRDEDSTLMKRPAVSRPISFSEAVTRSDLNGTEETRIEEWKEVVWKEVEKIWKVLEVKERPVMVERLSRRGNEMNVTRPVMVEVESEEVKWNILKRRQVLARSGRQEELRKVEIMGQDEVVDSDHRAIYLELSSYEVQREGGAEYGVAKETFEIVEGNKPLSMSELDRALQQLKCGKAMNDSGVVVEYVRGLGERGRQASREEFNLISGERSWSLNPRRFAVIPSNPADRESTTTTTKILDIASSHSNTEVKLEPAVKDSTMTGFEQIAQDHFAPEEGTGMMGSDAQLLSTIEKRQNRPLRSTLEPPAMNINRERDVSWRKPTTQLGGGWAPHSTTDSHDWRLTQHVRRSAAPTTQLHPPAANPRLPKFTGKRMETFQCKLCPKSYKHRQSLYNHSKIKHRDQAAHFFSRLLPHHQCSYALLKEKLRTCFNIVQAPAILRKQLQDVRQGMEESLQEFASRIQQLAMDAHPSLVAEAVEPMAVDAFIRVCKEKLAAYSALNREPVTVELAVNLVEGVVTNQQTVFGSTVPKLRQVFRFEKPTQTQVLGQFRDVNLQLKPWKCHLIQERVPFLGRVVSQDGIEMDPGKVSRCQQHCYIGAELSQEQKLCPQSQSGPVEEVWSPSLGGVFFSFPLCWSEASVLQDGVNILYEREDCGGKQVRDPWRHHRPRQERHHSTDTRKQQTTNEDRSGSIKQHLRLVSYIASLTTPPIVTRCSIFLGCLCFLLLRVNNAGQTLIKDAWKLGYDELVEGDHKAICLSIGWKAAKKDNKKRRKHRRLRNDQIIEYRERVEERTMDEQSLQGIILAVAENVPSEEGPIKWNREWWRDAEGGQGLLDEGAQQSWGCKNGNSKRKKGNGGGKFKHNRSEQSM
ncbi:hypothetical protein CAPTEDRAFT_198589 [Capitella teleta]|uniref:C2H2-type domain-containing protein n=1 Tax=Capitella teleta TaxID=283909 RepID=R7V7K6_CAPTE|nr:hypothetical protein CAPTEDRAFT_198589 [Capitella teleta]|eukprot:ELU11720.1 hypothetical protein CAPTEDRAFT_198589 [Capitella teleta]